MRLTVAVLLIGSVSCVGQQVGFRDRGVTYTPDRDWATLMLPNAGKYQSQTTDLVRYIQANGGNAGNIKFGGDFFNASFLTARGVILGASVGGLFSGVHNGLANVGYGNLLFGARLLTRDILQMNLISNFTVVRYSIGGILPPGTPLPPSNSFFLRGTTFGGGPAFQMVFNLRTRNTYSIGLGLEGGVTFLDPQAIWRFGYEAIGSNGYSRFRSTPVAGPNVDAMMGYIRVSFVVRFE